MRLKPSLWQIPALWSLVGGERKDSAHPQTILERLTRVIKRAN